MTRRTEAALVTPRRSPLRSDTSGRPRPRAPLAAQRTLSSRGSGRAAGVLGGAGRGGRGSWAPPTWVEIVTRRRRRKTRGGRRPALGTSPCSPNPARRSSPECDDRRVRYAYPPVAQAVTLADMLETPARTVASVGVIGL